MRASMLEVLNSDYVRTARAKGLIERRVIMRHAFRNAPIPLVTVVALGFGDLFAGAIRRFRSSHSLPVTGS
jgi:peptide/nickel transport system permease protein